MNTYHIYTREAIAPIVMQGPNAEDLRFYIEYRLGYEVLRIFHVNDKNPKIYQTEYDKDSSI